MTTTRDFLSVVAAAIATFKRVGGAAMVLATIAAASAVVVALLCATIIYDAFFNPGPEQFWALVGVEMVSGVILALYPKLMGEDEDGFILALKGGGFCVSTIALIILAGGSPEGIWLELFVLAYFVGRFVPTIILLDQ
jgi:hypothetical protein